MAITYHAGRRIQATSTDVAEVYRGETPVTVGSDTVITFLQDGKFTPTSSFNVEYLVVAGGGQGGQSNAGGGGAGGYLANNSKSHGVTAQDYIITIGGKGTSAGSISQRGTAGENSSIVPTSGTSFISIGGGGGGSEQANPETGGNGGSGGGGNGYAGEQNASNGLGGTGTSGQGNAGGNGSSGGGATWRGGGGGGSASAGANGSVSGNGGNGTQNDISGTNTYYSAGGGGGCYQGTAGSGGTGGGGNGSQTGVGGHATTYGSGGGGSDNGGGSNAGGNGGDGIVIIRFATSESYNTLTSKPTDVQVGSRFEETDTRKMYNFTEGLQFEDNFSDFTADTTVDGTEVNGWTPNDASQAWIDEGTNALQFNQTNESSNNAIVFDMQSSYGMGTNVSDTKWRLDYTSNLSSFSGGQNQSRHWFGLASGAEDIGLQTAQDAIWIHCSPYGSDWGVDTSDNTVAPQATGTSLTFATSTDYFWSLIRDGDTVTAYRWTDGTRTSTAQTSTQDISAKTITNLRYIKYSNRNQTSVGGVAGAIKDISFYNGVTDTTSNVWKEIGT